MSSQIYYTTAFQPWLPTSTAKAALASSFNAAKVGYLDTSAGLQQDVAFTVANEDKGTHHTLFKGVWRIAHTNAQTGAVTVKPITCNFTVKFDKAFHTATEIKAAVGGLLKALTADQITAAGGTASIDNANIVRAFMGEVSF